MSIWFNNDNANSKPHFPELRQVAPVSSLTTANTTSAAANSIIFTQIGGANSIPSTISVGDFVYTTGGSLSRFPDGSFFDDNDIGFFRSNNTVRTIDSANAKITLANVVITTIASGSTVWFANNLVKSGVPANTYSDTIMVTVGRMANTQGTTFGGGSNVSNTQLGAVNQGWNLIKFKTNNDGTKRFLKETLVALSNTVAFNVSSANTSSNAVFGGV
jgi:hypothetical protein